MYKYRRLIISVIALILAAVLLAGLFISVFATPSSEIKEDIKDLEEKAEEIEKERKRLQEELNSTNAEMSSTARQKAVLDQEIELNRQEVENINAQLRQYNLLIATKQTELDDLQTEQEEMLARYKNRIRAMQEQGDISYWAVIFNAKSFSQMLNRLAMVEEIAKTDKRMMEELRVIAAEVLTAKEDLAAEKVAVEEKKVELAAAEEALAEKRVEADKLLVKLKEEADKLAEEEKKYEDLENELADEIGRLEKEYTEALRKEQEQANQNNNNNSGNSGSSGNGSGQSFLYPLPASCGSWMTSPYGTRWHPIWQEYRFHNGVDLAANTGTPIYASKSGTVTTAKFAYSWGYYVVINHGDGFSTLYAHMTHYTVSKGDRVSRGEVIGYVGSTGNSTGAHLHFTMYKNGSTVDPMAYVRVP